MIQGTLARRTIRFVNIAHTFDHFILLIYPTAVLAIAAGRGLSYAELIGLSTGAFVAFGLFSLPAGWLADRIGRRNLFAIFFLGYGASCMALAFAVIPLHFAGGLLILGVFSAIYHPVGAVMLVSHTDRLGRDLGLNGVCGNMGAALAAGVTAMIASAFGWQAAFLVPGAVCVLAGVAFLILVPDDGGTLARAKTSSKSQIPVSRPIVLAIIYACALIAGGMTFNITTISLPKVLDERLGLDLPLWLIGSLATSVFVLGALMQLLMGRLIDRYPLPLLFTGLASLQPLGLGLAAFLTGGWLLLGLVLTMAAVYGQVVISDGMLARYVPGRYQSRAYGIRYFLGFASAGSAVPLIAFAHAKGGFPLVLTIAAIFGGVVFIAAASFARIAAATPSPVAAE